MMWHPVLPFKCDLGVPKRGRDQHVYSPLLCRHHQVMVYRKMCWQL